MRGFFRNRSGSMAVLAGFTLPVVLGAGAFAIDLSNLYVNKAKIQMAADSGALAGVLSLAQPTAAATEALSVVTQNTPAGYGTIATSQDISVGTWDATAKTFTVTSTNPNAIRVKTYRNVARGNPVLTYFGKFVGASYLEVTGSAIAKKYGGACVEILNATASSALSASGSGQLTMNCNLQVNSTANQAAKAGGSSTITSNATCVTGGYSGNGWTPTPKTGCAAMSDPLASLPEPTAPGCTMNNPTLSGGTATPTCAYSGTISLSGNITMQPGVYYLKGANLTVGNSTNLSGSGVTIFLDKNSTLNLGGGGTISLTAPTSGTYAGILIFASRSTPNTQTMSLGGNGTLALNGTVYAPTVALSMSGNSTYATKVGYVIVDTLSFGGSSSFIFNGFPTTGVTPKTLTIHASLVQ